MPVHLANGFSSVVTWSRKPSLTPSPCPGWETSLLFRSPPVPASIRAGTTLYCNCYLSVSFTWLHPSFLPPLWVPTQCAGTQEGLVNICWINEWMNEYLALSQLCPVPAVSLPTTNGLVSLRSEVPPYCCFHNYLNPRLFAPGLIQPRTRSENR